MFCLAEKDQINTPSSTEIGADEKLFGGEKVSIPTLAQSSGVKDAIIKYVHDVQS